MYTQIAAVSELGINMSALARVVIRKYRSQEISELRISTTGKLRRVVIYLDEGTHELLAERAESVNLTRSELLRRFFVQYLDEHLHLIKKLF